MLNFEVGLSIINIYIDFTVKYMETRSLAKSSHFAVVNPAIASRGLSLRVNYTQT